MTEDDILARLLHRDANLLILDKPFGLPVHPGPRIKDHLELYLDHLRFGLPRRPHLAHRLDRDTSGCLVLGRHPRALSRLGRLFASGRVEKTYLAVCEGVPKKERGRIDHPIRKIEWKTGWKIVTARSGKEALTFYRLIDTRGGVSLIEFTPKTGRTHQIRVHGASIGCPVMGDPFYGREGGVGGSQQLHARRVRLAWNETKGMIEATAPLPVHMQDAMARHGLELREAEPVS